jgi:hypothetical protein
MEKTAGSVPGGLFHFSRAEGKGMVQPVLARPIDMDNKMLPEELRQHSLFSGTEGTVTRQTA